MFPFFRQKSETHDGVADIEKNVDCLDRLPEKPEIIPQDEAVDDDMTKDLAVLIGNAIAVWTKKYGLENLPKEIVLDQAISIMVAVRDSMK